MHCGCSRVCECAHAAPACTYLDLDTWRPRRSESRGASPRPGPRQSTEVEQLDTVCSEVMGMLYLIWGFRCLGVTDRLCRPHVLIIVDVWSYHDSLSLMFVHDGATHMQQTHTHTDTTPPCKHTLALPFLPPHPHTHTHRHMHTHAHTRTLHTNN